jgi:DtxR family transcriptional regulator, Mn-dependent transcriptional regulator
MSDTPAQEDCLLALHQLGARGAPVATTALARALGVSAPTATAAIKRLAQEGLVRHTPYRGAELTAAGRKIARNVLRRHRLIESFLVAIMGYPWDEVHEEAHRLEHAVSAKFVERLDANLGHPQFDPHGDPIPTVGGRMAPEPSLSLADLADGESGTVKQMQDEEAGFLRFAKAHGLVPGAKVKVVEVGDYQGPIRVRSRGLETSLTTSVAGRILVSRSTRRKSGSAASHTGAR